MNAAGVISWGSRRARPIAAVYLLLLLTATHLPGANLNPPELDFQPDKFLHFAAYVLLTALLAAARPAGIWGTRRAHLIAAAVLAASIAYIDELTQDLVGRHTSLTDLAANLVGVVAASLAIALSNRAGSAREARVGAARAALGLLAPLAAMVLLLPGMGLELPLPVPRDAVLGYRIEADMILHGLGALVFALLLMAAEPLRIRMGSWGSLLMAALLVGALGPAIELAQGQVGRGREWSDAIAHEVGLALALLGTLAYTLVRKPADRRAAAPADGSPSAEEHPHQLVGHTAVVSGLTLVSRLTGLARDAVLAGLFGLSGVMDAFFIGFLIPNLFRRLFGEGALAAAFIPAYSELLARDGALARRLAWLNVALMLAVLGALMLVGEGVLWAMLSFGGFSDSSQLAIRLAMVMLPYMPLVCLVAMLGGVMQVRGRFAAPAAAPVLLNLVMISGALAAAHWIGATENPQRVALAVGASVVAAGFLQAIWMLASVARLEPITFRFAGTGQAMRSMLGVWLPMVFGLAVFQINALFDHLIAFGLAPREGGATHLNLFGRQLEYPVQVGGVAALQWAQRLYQFPLGVFGIALATAIFPALALAAGRADAIGQQRYEQTLRHGLRLSVFIGLPAAAGIILVRLPLTQLIYQHGSFSYDQAVRVAFITTGYAAGIWAYSTTHVVTRAFYAMKDSTTPLIVSVVMVGFNLMLNLTLVWFLGAAGLAWATAASASVQLLVLLLAIRTYAYQPVDASVIRSWLKSLAMAAVMAALLYPLMRFAEGRVLSKLGAGGMVVAMATLGALIYAGGAWVLRCEELRWLLRRKV